PAPVVEHAAPVAPAPVPVAAVEEAPAPAAAPAAKAPLTVEHATAERVALLSPSGGHPGPGSGDTGYRGQKISLDFKDADRHNVLRVVADVSNLNIIATDDVKGKLTLHLNDVPWDQALDLVLHANRLEAVREGNVVRISTVGRLKEERE